MLSSYFNNIFTQFSHFYALQQCNVIVSMLIVFIDQENIKIKPIIECLAPLELQIPGYIQKCVRKAAILKIGWKT